MHAHRSSRWRRGVAATAFLAVPWWAASCGDDDAAPPGDPSGGSSTSAAAGDGYYGPPAAPGGATGPAPAGGTAVVRAEGFAFGSTTVAPGATVTFANADAATHTFTADDGAFDSGPVEGGGEAEVVAPTDPGAHPFHCEIHPSMTGTLTVT
ncbi:MAG: cupredoxin domain-containing protein [Acidimicrobiia bacterium]